MDKDLNENQSFYYELMMEYLNILFKWAEVPAAFKESTIETLDALIDSLREEKARLMITEFNQNGVAVSLLENISAQLVKLNEHIERVENKINESANYNEKLY